MPNTISPNAVTIGDMLRQIARPVYDAKAAVAEASLVRDKLAEDHRGVRETIMAKLAALSAQHSWSLADLNDGIKCAVKGENEPDNSKTLSTFLTEIKYAGHPLVRDKFTAITTVVNDAWEAEQLAAQEAKANENVAPTPIKKAFARRYHAIVRALKAVAKDGRSFTTVLDYVAFAYECDPDHDAANIAKRIERIAKQIQDMFVDFPHEDLKISADYLRALDVEPLQKARAEKLARMGGERPLTPAAAEPPAEPAKPATRQRSATATVVTPVAKVEPVAMVDVDELLNECLPLMNTGDTVSLSFAAAA